MNKDTEYHHTFAKKLELLWERIHFHRRSNPSRVPIPTISVGNLSIGGTGKTPFVIWLLERLKDFKVAVLHSGYGGGDEGRMLQSKFPDAFIWAHKQRHIGLQQAQAWGAELILLDDAFQCKRLHRDIDIVLVDASQNLHEQNLIPFGRLRESPKALARADLIVANHVTHRDHITREIRIYSQAPILYMRPILEKITPHKSAVFCGLGNPKHFLNALAAQSIPVATCLIALDHETPPARTWRRFIRSCHQHQISQLLCTEKDFHRIHDFKIPFPVVPVKMHLQVV